MPRRFRSLLGAAAFLFALLFTTAATIQYWFLQWKLNDETKSFLRDNAEEMRGQIAFADTWNLEAYRRATEGPDIYLITTKDGTIIDTHGCLRTMLWLMPEIGGEGDCRGRIFTTPPRSKFTYETVA